MDERLTIHSASERPPRRTETDVTGTCRPVSFVFQCPLPFELFLPPTLLTKESLHLRRNAYPVTSWAASLKGETCWMPLEMQALLWQRSLRRKRVVKLLSSLSPKLFFTWSADKCLILQSQVSDFVLFFFSPKCHFHLLLRVENMSKSFSER